MEDSRPRNVTQGVKFCVEADAGVENTKLLHLGLEIQEARPYIKENMLRYHALDLTNSFVGLQPMKASDTP